MNYQTKRIAIALAALLLGTGGAFAGDGNVLYLVQNGGSGGVNNFTSDQTLASDSSIGGNGPLAPALQSGSSNTANLTISCTLDLPCFGGKISLTQVSSPNAALGNTATVTVRNSGTASLYQSGDGNSAAILVDGGNGNVNQQGSGNAAKLQVGDNVSGTINQWGNGNQADMQVTGTNGSATLTQQGNGNSYIGGTSSPIAVKTNGNVTITQTSF